MFGSILTRSEQISERRPSLQRFTCKRCNLIIFDVFMSKRMRITFYGQSEFLIVFEAFNLLVDPANRSTED